MHLKLHCITLLRRGGGSRARAACAERSQIAIGSAAVDDRRGVLTSLLSGFRFLKRNLYIFIHTHTHINFKGHCIMHADN